MEQNDKPLIYTLKHSNLKQTETVYIEIFGFPQNGMDAMFIAGLLEQVPPSHLVKLHQIKHKANGSFCGDARFVIQKSGSPRSYVKKETYVIELYRLHQMEAVKWALFHELGHFVFYKHLSPALRKQWVTELCSAEKPITQYGERNAQEEFAECYACYLANRRKLSVLPAKYKYMSKLMGFSLQ